MAEQRQIRPAFLSDGTTIHHQIFFASKGGVCWSLLGSGPAFLVSWTASPCSANPANASPIRLQRFLDYTVEPN